MRFFPRAALLTGGFLFGGWLGAALTLGLILVYGRVIEAEEFAALALWYLLLWIMPVLVLLGGGAGCHVVHRFRQKRVAKVLSGLGYAITFLGVLLMTASYLKG